MVGSAWSPVRHAHSQPSRPRGAGRVRRVPRVAIRLRPGLPVAVVRLDPGLPLPSYAHPGDAGADLMSTVDLTLAARRAGPGPDRDRDRPARGVRRAGPPALGAGRPARAVDRQHPGHHRRRLPRRDQGAAGQPRPRRSRSSCAAATGSPSSSCSGSSGPCSSRSTTCRSRSAAPAATVQPESRAQLPAREQDPAGAPSLVHRRRTDVPPQVPLGAGRARRRRPGRRRRRSTRRRRTAGAAQPARDRGTPTTCPTTGSTGSTSARSVVAPTEGTELRLQVDEQTGEVAVRDAGRRRRCARAARLRGAARRRPLERGAAPDRRRRLPARRHRHRARGPLGHRAGLPDAGRAARRHARRCSRRGSSGSTGPRWLLRATFLGLPAVEPDGAQRWEDALAAVVVAPRHATRCPSATPLPLALPDDAQRMQP